MSIPVTNYAFVKPEHIIGDNVQNIHIFACNFDPSTGNFKPSEAGSRCGICHALANTNSAFAVGNTDEEALRKARLIAADLKNRGEEVCGQCVATLYSDGI